MSRTLGTALPIELLCIELPELLQWKPTRRTLNSFPLSKEVSTGLSTNVEMFGVTQRSLGLFGSWLFRDTNHRAQPCPPPQKGHRVVSVQYFITSVLSTMKYRFVVYSLKNVVEAPSAASRPVKAAFVSAGWRFAGSVSLLWQHPVCGKKRSSRSSMCHQEDRDAALPRHLYPEHNKISLFQ